MTTCIVTTISNNPHVLHFTYFHTTVKISVHHTGRSQLYGITIASQGTFEVRVDTGHFDSNFSSACQAKRSYPDRGLPI
jgi:hypothetical protein